MTSQNTVSRLIFLLLDLMCLNLAIGLIIYFAGYGTYHVISTSLLHGNLSWIITYFVFTRERPFLEEGIIKRVLQISNRALIFIAVAAVIALLLRPNPSFPAFLLKYTALFYFSQLCLYSFAYTYLKYKRRKGLNTDRVVIVGTNETCQQLRNAIDRNPLLGYRFIGYIYLEPGNNTDVLGPQEKLESIIRENNIQMVIVSLSLFTNEKYESDYLNLCYRLGVRLRFVPENQRWLRIKMNRDSVGDMILINPLEMPLDKIDSRIIKRLFDITISIICIVFLFSWLFPIIAVLIKLSSKGPVFFIQKRTGINNKPFNLIKFRSMEVNELADIQQASIDDPRTTYIGRLLRRTSIDELPQFFNVLLGNMSVIGPRPHMLKHTEQYTHLIDHFLFRHYVKPGVSGWAQVSGFRGETDELWKMEKRFEYDVEYIENWTFWWDVQIIWLTLFGLKSLESMDN